MSVIYDYSTITPEQLTHDINILLMYLNRELVSQFILVENFCDNKLTSAEAVRLAKLHGNMKIVRIEASEKVSTGRARIAAMDKTTDPFILFLSAGNMPKSTHFLGKVIVIIIWFVLV